LSFFYFLFFFSSQINSTLGLCSSLVLIDPATLAVQRVSGSSGLEDALHSWVSGSGGGADLQVRQWLLG
jgi:hypothetical protein